MSLILEALRKSEAERRRGDAPNVYTELPPAPRVQRTAIPVWGWIVPAVLVALAAGWLLLRQTPPSATAVVATGPAPVAAVPRRTTDALPPVSRLSPPPAPAVAAPPPAPSKPVDQPMSEASVPVPPASPRGAPATAITPITPITAGQDDATMQLSDLSVEARKALPPLKLSMHMWNDDPDRRFIILDGTRLREGDRIGNAVITAITPDGAVLDWDGRRIKLQMH